jgi:hypothetical protein
VEAVMAGVMVAMEMGMEAVATATTEEVMAAVEVAVMAERWGMEASPWSRGHTRRRLFFYNAALSW